MVVRCVGIKVDGIVIELELNQSLLGGGWQTRRKGSGRQ